MFGSSLLSPDPKISLCCHYKNNLKILQTIYKWKIVANTSHKLIHVKTSKITKSPQWQKHTNFDKYKKVTPTNPNMHTN